MEQYFINHHIPSTNLINSISLIGLSVPTLRNFFLTDQSKGPAEIILTLPPNSPVIQPSHIELIFTEGDISIEAVPKVPKYFSTTFTNEFGLFTHIHCLITYEAISPKITQNSKDRIPSIQKLNLPFSPDQTDQIGYVPIALCLATTSSYIDTFHEILESLYSFLSEIINSDRISSNQLISSVEFMRSCCFLLNDTIVPPYNTLGTLKIGGSLIEIPVESNTGLLHAEKCIAILLDLIDIGNIIDVWECLTLNQGVFLISGNEYLLYLILEAFKELMFPFKWSLYIVPVLGPKLIDYLSAPVPILIGLNSKIISSRDAQMENPSASVLDIDSNMFYPASGKLLCSCEKGIISRKLQLLKTYYYVDRERFSSYKMTSIEQGIDDIDFINTVKLLVTKTGSEKERIFIYLIKHVFLDFFVRGIGRFDEFFVQDAFNDSFKFQAEDFLKSVQKCENCKMDKYWKSFVETSTFHQFLEFKGKFDDSYFKRFTEIIQAKSHGIYNIYSSGRLYRFDIERALTPRKLIKLIKEDQMSKSKNFENDSGVILRIEIEKELRQFKDYYRQAEAMNKYKPRKTSFSASYNIENKTSDKPLFYGKMGIIRLTSVLLSRVRPEKFKNFSTVQEIILPYLNTSAAGEEYCWNPSITKLYFSIKNEAKDWDFESILEIFQKIKDFKIEIEQSFQLVSGVIDQMIKVMPEVDKKIEEIGGKIKFIAKAVKGEIDQPLARVRSDFFDESKAEVIRFKLNKLKTTINENSEISETRKKYKKVNSHKIKSPNTL